MAVTKVIQLPAPVQTRPATSYWGLSNLTINPLSKTATVTLVTVDAAGVQVPGGDSLSFGVTNAQMFSNAIAPLANTVLTQLTQLLIANGKVAAGSVVVDAT
jgi:hypothetical protein